MVRESSISGPQGVPDDILAQMAQSSEMRSMQSEVSSSAREAIAGSSPFDNVDSMGRDEPSLDDLPDDQLAQMMAGESAHFEQYVAEMEARNELDTQLNDPKAAGAALAIAMANDKEPRNRRGFLGPFAVAAGALGIAAINADKAQGQERLADARGRNTGNSRPERINGLTPEKLREYRMAYLTALIYGPDGQKGRRYASLKEAEAHFAKKYADGSIKSFMGPRLYVGSQWNQYEIEHASEMETEDERARLYTGEGREDSRGIKVLLFKRKEATGSLTRSENEESDDCWYAVAVAEGLTTPSNPYGIAFSKKLSSNISTSIDYLEGSGKYSRDKQLFHFVSVQRP